MNNFHKNIRLKHYDYSQVGAYFVTICTWERKNLFGEICKGVIQLSQWGEKAKTEWEKTGILRKDYIKNDIYIIMPNHIHGIIEITKQITKSIPINEIITPVEKFGQPRKGALGTIIQAYKSEVTKNLRGMGFDGMTPVWQPGYYERIIRNAHEFGLIEEYILRNPEQWEYDHENPYHKSKEKLSELDKILKV